MSRVVRALRESQSRERGWAPPRARLARSGEAIAAEYHVVRTAARMHRNVHMYARDIADRYLARFGYTYDSWMAAVGQGATPHLVAQAARIEDGLRAWAQGLAARPAKRR